MSDNISQLRDLENRLEAKADDVEAARQLIVLLRPLAEQSPREYGHRLADAWTRYAASLSHAIQAPLLAGDFSTTSGQRLSAELPWLRQISSDNDPDSLVQLVKALQSLAADQVDSRPDLAEPLLRETHDHLGRLSANQEWLTRRMDVAGWNVLLARSSQLLAKCCLRLGDHQNAIQYGQEAEAKLTSVGVRERALEDELADTLRTLALALSHEHADKATLKLAKKKISRAVALYDRLRGELKALGDGPNPFHEDCAHAQYIEAKILMAQGKKIRALATYEAAANQFVKMAKSADGTGLTNDDRYQEVVTGAVEAHEAAGEAAEAQRLRKRYGLTANP